MALVKIKVMSNFSLLGLDSNVVKINLGVTGLQEYETNVKKEISPAQVIEGQGQVKFKLAQIGFKLGGNKPGCDRSMK